MLGGVGVGVAPDAPDLDLPDEPPEEPGKPSGESGKPPGDAYGLPVGLIPVGEA